jgi:enoyl-CoA hydratase
MIERTLQDGILTLRLAHGKASALDVELLEALQRELEGVAAEVRALILTGTGSIFSAGVDLLRLTKEGEPYVRRFLPLLSGCIRTLFTFPRPVVMAANGHAIAGGCILMQTGDIRLMAEGNGRIGIPELLVGVPFPILPLEVVRFAVPPDKMQTLVYTGKTVLPPEALTMGLIDEVVAADKLQARALELARQLAQVPPASFRLTKQLLRAPTLERIDRGQATSDAAALAVWTAAQTQETIQEYLRKTLRK